MMDYDPADDAMRSSYAAIEAKRERGDPVCKRKAQGRGPEIDIELTLRGPLAATLRLHAARRRRKPVDVLADILEAVLGDDIVDAVLDDSHAG